MILDNIPKHTAARHISNELNGKPNWGNGNFNCGRLLTAHAHVALLEKTYKFSFLFIREERTQKNVTKKFAESFPLSLRLFVSGYLWVFVYFLSNKSFKKYRRHSRLETSNLGESIWKLENFTCFIAPAAHRNRSLVIAQCR